MARRGSSGQSQGRGGECAGVSGHTTTILQWYRRRARVGLALVLPLLLLRALVPVGFMAAPEHGALKLVMCMGVPGTPQDLRGVDHASGSGSHNPCPFALSASAPLPSLSLAIPGRPGEASARLAFGVDRPFIAPGPARQQTARAPPNAA